VSIGYICLEKRGEKTLIRMVQCGTRQGNRPLRRLKLIWENQVKKDVQMMDANSEGATHVIAVGRGK